MPANTEDEFRMQNRRGRKKFHKYTYTNPDVRFRRKYRSPGPKRVGNSKKCPNWHSGTLSKRVLQLHEFKKECYETVKYDKILDIKFEKKPIKVIIHRKRKQRYQIINNYNFSIIAYDNDYILSHMYNDNRKYYDFIARFKHETNLTSEFYFPESLRFTSKQIVLKTINRELLLLFPIVIFEIIINYINIEYLLQSDNYVLDLNEWVATDKLTNLAIKIKKIMQINNWNS